MRRFLFLGLFLLLAVAVDNSLASNTHYHRYMLSDYKPQHNPRTQKDYKRIKMRSPAKVEDKGAPEIKKSSPRSKEPVIKLTQGEEKLQLHELMVRIYQDQHFLCVGTIISSVLVATVGSCFVNTKTDHVTVKNFYNEVYEGMRANVNETYLKGEGPYLEVIGLEKPFLRPNLTENTVKLCDAAIKKNALVELPIWLRQRHSIHSQIAEVLPLQECRHRMKDLNGTVVQDQMICVRNQKYTSTCQHAMGNPLVYDGMICGINVLGHNCPKHIGLDLYSSIYDAVSFTIAGMELIKHSKMEDAIL
ncbi:hypothetical protein KR067_006058 [Drosophila pandora]|nr:hypothetical protein KR067_006058 [Drosophila pandora]